MRHILPPVSQFAAVAVLAAGFTLFATRSAQAQATPGGFSFMDPQILMLVLVFAVFYFIVLRPQQQKAKRHREMLQALKRGDKVLTAGGILGNVVKLTSDTEVSVEIAPNVQVQIVRATIAECIQPPATEAANSNQAKKDGASKTASSPFSALAFWRKKD
ncbi:MAG: preprotein translocase subunit YajC [Alphaproteobacteria bacterium]|nr:preprotein translocase subunit YajC [Alphaproteobacteria bacterium]